MITFAAGGGATQVLSAPGARHRLSRKYWCYGLRQSPLGQRWLEWPVSITATALIYLGLDLHLAEDEQASGVRIIGVVDDCVDETILL